ncbi:MAG: nucleotidyltransferase family protein [Candidatus Helarchaeales archaeon]
MKTLKDVEKILRENKRNLKEKYGISKIGVFGSHARGEQVESSDIDVVVEFEKPIGMKFFEIWDHLEKILDSKVDLLTLMP